MATEARAEPAELASKVKSGYQSVRQAPGSSGESSRMVTVHRAKLSSRSRGRIRAGSRPLSSAIADFGRILGAPQLWRRVRG
jgi:hypothetical protein